MFGDNVKRLRHERGFSQAALAASAGLSELTVSMVERNASSPQCAAVLTPGVKALLWEFLGKPPDPQLVCRAEGIEVKIPGHFERFMDLS